MQLPLLSICIINNYFSKMITWNTQQHLKEDLLEILFILHRLFLSSFPFFCLCKLSCTKKHCLYNLCCISYSNVLHRVGNTCIGGCFSEDCFIAIRNRLGLLQLERETERERQRERETERLKQTKTSFP